METIEKINELLGPMTVEAEKVYAKGNKSAATRARKYAQEIKTLLNDFRKEMLDQTKG